MVQDSSFYSEVEDRFAFKDTMKEALDNFEATL